VFAPIGSTNDTFRACMVPGTPFSALLPFKTEPEDRNVRHARELPLSAAAGLWKLAELAHAALASLHEGGFAHGDAELHNFVVSPSPLEIMLVDFEAAVLRSTMSDDAWHKRCQEDLDPLLRLGVLLQCSLGRQPGPFGDAARARIEGLFRDPRKFQREIERQSELGD